MFNDIITYVFGGVVAVMVGASLYIGTSFAIGLCRAMEDGEMELNKDKYYTKDK